MKKKILLIAVILVFALLAASLSSCGKQAVESIDETPAAQTPDRSCRNGGTCCDGRTERLGAGGN